MKKFINHEYANCPEPQNHNKKEHWLLPEEQKHTPTLVSADIVMREYGDNYKIIGSVPAIRLTDADIIVVSFGATPEQTKAYAEGIVHAMNAHDELVAALKRAEKFISEEFPNMRSSMFGEMRDALAKAEN